MVSLQISLGVASFNDTVVVLARVLVSHGRVAKSRIALWHRGRLACNPISDRLPSFTCFCAQVFMQVPSVVMPARQIEPVTLTGGPSVRHVQSS